MVTTTLSGQLGAFNYPLQAKAVDRDVGGR